ncbi:MAG TPA: hypothetical protein VMV92_03795 [Streptosporangiaceae bacterium]|nr:hypothetical protein [Streptosporangiaceae bacterium]
MRGHVDAESLALCAEGLLSRRRSARIRSHLSGCAQCAATQARLSEVPALLARVPPPSLPPDVVARLDAVLRAESGAAVPSSLSPPASPGRRRWPLLGRPLLHWPVTVRVLATAGVLVVVAGISYGVARFSSSSSSASSASSAAAPAAGTPALRPGATANAPAASALPVIHSETRYREGQLATQLAGVLLRNPPGSLGRTPGSAGGLARPADITLQGCVARFAAGGEVRLVDVSSYQGRPATVIVVDSRAGGPATAWVVGPGCSADRPDLITRVVLPATG